MRLYIKSIKTIQTPTLNQVKSGEKHHNPRKTTFDNCYFQIFEFQNLKKIKKELKNVFTLAQ